MMYPEAFVEDKDVLNAYHNEYGNYFEEPRGLQKVCCIKENSQYCPKCGCYHKTNTAKRCVCLTLTSLMACLCFVILTLSVTFHIEGMQSGYETVHHFLVLVTNIKTNDTIESKQAVSLIETPTTDTKVEIPTTTELLFTNSLDEATELVEEYEDDVSRENYESESYKERKKRSILSVDAWKTKHSVTEDFNCTSFMSLHSKDSTNSETENITSYVKGDDEYAKRFTYCTSLKKDFSSKTIRKRDLESDQFPEKPIGVTEDRPKYFLNSQIKSEENYLKAQNSDEQEEKLSQKRNYDFDYKSMAQDPYYEISNQNLHDPDVVPISRASDQNIPYITSSQRTRPYPPTGPDGSNYGESMKTSQQLTVANNQIWKPVCFRTQNNPNPSSIVCIPMTSRQFDPSHLQQNHYSYDYYNKECVNGNCDKTQNGFNAPLPTVITPNTSPSELNREQVLTSPTNSPDIHLPTAISSPNPYFFPTLNGAPIMTPYDLRQISPNLGPAWLYRGPPVSPGFPQTPAPHLFGPPRFHGGFSGFEPFPQPQLHMLPPQTPMDLQNPVICMYVPSRSHQFPMVDGVTEVKNRNKEGSQSTGHYKATTNSSSHQTFRSDNEKCGDGEFPCRDTDACIPVESWCDGRVDCLDASDEVQCSCKRRLDKRRLCDGYLDCPAGEDELGCFGCDQDSFSCQDWERGREQSTCIPLSKMCDNVVDCINHRDELECTLLSESIVPHKTHFISYTRGILHRNWKGRWYPACTGPEVTEWAIQACLADAGPLTGDPHIEMTPTEYPGPYIIPNGLEIYSLSQMCRDQKVVTYVTCPPVLCGTRVNKGMLDSSMKIREAQLQNTDTMQERSTLSEPGLRSSLSDPDLRSTLSELGWRSSLSDPDLRSALSEPGLVALVSSIVDGGKLYKKKENSEETLNNNNNNVNEKKSKTQFQEDHNCENCNLETVKEGSEWTGLIASKVKDYQTQFEPEEEEYQRWTRDADDILGVVGGRRSRSSSWPWLIALYKDGRFHCGGVIINEHWVMTAAHCMEKFTKHYFEVQAGMLRRFSFSPQEQTRRVSHVVLHTLYDTFDMQNDLALLRLHSKLKFNRWVRPICLPPEHISQFGPPPGSLCTAVGWGATREGGADPDDLHEVNVPILPYCKHRADQEGAGLCAGYLHGGHDACQGDSGGPLLCKMPGEEERWYVAGVVSHGEGCARPDEPGVYTRVFLFIDWIKSIINEQGNSLSPDLMPLQQCPGQQCSSGRRCVPLIALCNSKVDCLNAEDETLCSDNYLQKSLSSSDNTPNLDINIGHVNADNNTGDVRTEASSTPLSQENYDDLVMKIHEVLNQPIEHSTDQNNESYDEKESSVPIDKTTLMPITEGSKHHMLAQEKNEFTTENLHEEAGSDDKNGESTDNYLHGKTFTLSPESQSTTELENEENWSSTKAVSYKESEDGEIISTLDSVKWYSAPSTLQNGGTTPTFPSLEDSEITTLKSYIKEDTQLINEMVFQNKNSTDSEDVSDVHYITIPPYLVPIVFSNKTSHNIDHTKNGQNNNISTEEDAMIISTFSPLENNSETTTLSTMSSTPLDESFCKNFMKSNETKSEAEDPKNRTKSSSSFGSEKIDIHRDNSNLSVENKNMSGITSKVKEKKESRFVCKRYKQALLKKRRCDGIIDCEDGTDEMRCSCRERLMHLDSRLNCDGEIHCHDQTDEKHCANNCNKTAYFCPKSKMCIPQTHRCDGIQHCPEKDDEENCYALISDDGGIRLDRALVPEFRSEGIVAINSVSGWRPLCIDIKYGHSAAKRGCSALGFRGYEKFEEEMVKNETLHGTKGHTPASVCSGIRVKCSSNKADKFWIGQLLVEGSPMASVAMIHPQWLLTDPSICSQLHLESQYAEISMGRNQISDFGIHGVYEENRRINDVISFCKSSFCLLHAETPFHFNRKIRPIKFLLPNETSSTLDFHAVTISGRRFQKLKLNQSRLSHGDEELCFTITHRPVECYTLGGSSENGFIIMTMLYKSYVASTFQSFQIFCSAMTDVCFKKLSTFSSEIEHILENRSLTPKVSPPCEGIRCGKCVRWANVSDGELDCADRSDETLKAFSKRQQACQRDPSLCGCRTDQFQCPSGLCIDKSLYCDGTPQCENGSDEPMGCKDSCLAFLHFAYPHKICDGVRNCFDKSDEKWELCHNKTCSLEDAFVCKSSGKCIPREFVCDNEADCLEGDDEENCVSIMRYNLSEGILSQKQFGVWSPKCLQNTTSDFSKFCSTIGMKEAVTHEVITPNRTIIAVDGFSKVTLNNATTIVIRKGRPLVEVDSTSPCNCLYIKCL